MANHDDDDNDDGESLFAFNDTFTFSNDAINMMEPSLMGNNISHPDDGETTMSTVASSTIHLDVVDPNSTTKRQRSVTTNPFATIVQSTPTMNKPKPEKSCKKSILQLYQQHAPSTESSKKIVSKLKDIYKFKILPIEKSYHLHSFCLPTNGEIQDSEFDARPMVLLLGPYSTGKTSFIRHLLGGDFPGLHIGPEPTTDKFMALVHGDNDGVSYDDDEPEEFHNFFSEKQKPTDLVSSGKIIKGNTLTVTPELPFASLSNFGSAFLNHFHGSVSSSPLLRHITIVDTPGVLSGEKQRLSRDYDFAEVAKWFADRSDLILLLFDAHKLDISDELKEVVETIRPHNDDKIRCILNKADGVGREQLVRVYGSLMWSMGKLFHSPEVVRVYTGSYWDEPLAHTDFQTMFESDEWLLMHELMSLPSTSAERKVNSIVKRIRLVKVHMCVLGYLRQRMPRWIGHARVRETLIANLDQVFTQVCNMYGLSPGDMPDVNKFRKCLAAFDDFTIFPIPDQASLQQLDELITKDIPAIMKGAGGVSNASDVPRVALRGSNNSLRRRSKGRLSEGKKSLMEEFGFVQSADDPDFIETNAGNLGIAWVLVGTALLVAALAYLWVQPHGDLSPISEISLFMPP